MNNENGSAPASPIKLNERVECGTTGNVTINECDDYHSGLTKREHFTAMAMQGLLSSRDGDSQLHDNAPDWIKSVAETSLEFADALLMELDK